VALNQEGQIEVGSFGERRNKIFVLERARWMLLPTPCCGRTASKERRLSAFSAACQTQLLG